MSDAIYLLLCIIPAAIGLTGMAVFAYLVHQAPEGDEQPGVGFVRRK